jgi:hypothetical protein
MEDNNLQIDAVGGAYLSDVAKWAYFLSILGFIGIGLMVIIGLAMGTVMGSMPGMEAAGKLSGTFFFVLYLVIGIIYFFPIYYLNRFAGRMKAALRTNDQHTLNASLRFLKAHYQYIGILALICVVIYAVAIIGVFAFMGASHRF